MIKEKDNGSFILVVEDVEETRYGIEKLLKTDGYRVELARNEEEGSLKAKQQPPNLLLLSLALATNERVQTAKRIREQAGLTESVPVVIFSVGDIAEGEEVAIGNNIYLTRPDNFNQLRTLIHSLLLKPHFQD